MLLCVRTVPAGPGGGYALVDVQAEDGDVRCRHAARALSWIEPANQAASSGLRLLASDMRIFMPACEYEPVRALSDAQIRQFIEDGFVRLDRAFPRKLADDGRARLWRDLPCDPDDPATWTRPVIRLGYYGDEPFRLAVNTPVLHAAFDQLVGKGRWRPRADLGTFPVRFPSPDDPGDAGWHFDVSFPSESSDPNERKRNR